MEIPAFNTRKFTKALKKLGFVIDESKGKGSHAKAIHPSRKPIVPSQPPFIMIQRVQGDYYKPFREDLIKELKILVLPKKKFLNL